MEISSQTSFGSEKTTFTFSNKELDDEAGVNWHYFGARYYDAEIGRWLSQDPLAAKYPSYSPYNYCANNPLKFIDINGDSINVDDNLKDNKAVLAFFQSPEGYFLIAPFAYEGQVVKIAGEEIKFNKAGKYSTQNVNFVGVDAKKGPNTVPINSIGGEYFVGNEGVHSI